MSDEASRVEMFNQVQMVLAGHRAADGLHVIADTLAALTAFMSDSPGAGEKLLDGLLPDIKKTMRKNWHDIHASRMRSTGAGRA